MTYRSTVVLVVQDYPDRVWCRGADAPGRGDDAAAVRARHQAGGRPPAVPARPGGAAGIATTVLYSYCTDRPHPRSHFFSSQHCRECLSRQSWLEKKWDRGFGGWPHGFEGVQWIRTKTVRTVRLVFGAYPPARLVTCGPSFPFDTRSSLLVERSSR